MANAIANIQKPKLPSWMIQVMANRPAWHLGDAFDTPPRIGMKQGRFVKKISGKDYPIKGTEDGMDVVIMACQPRPGRQYFDSDYDPNSDGNKGPVCFSTSGETPDETSSQPQASSCLSCPMNQPGSARQGNGKACSRIQRMLVRLQNDDHIYQFDIKGMSIYGDDDPSQGLFNFQNYAKMLRQMGVQPDLVRTTVHADLGATVTKMLFQPGEMVEYDEFSANAALLETVDKDKLLTYTGAKKEEDGEAAEVAKPKTHTQKLVSGPAKSVQGSLTQSATPPQNVTLRANLAPPAQPKVTVKRTIVEEQPEEAEPVQAKPVSHVRPRVATKPAPKPVEAVAAGSEHEPLDIEANDEELDGILKDVG